MLEAFATARDTLYEAGDVAADVTQFVRHGRDAALTLRLLPYYGSETLQTWVIDCRSVADYTIRPGRVDADEIAVLAEAPELWAYTEPSVRLFCTRVPEASADALLGVLHRTFRETVGDAGASVSFEHGLGLAALYGRHGVVFSGPLPLARAYERALTSHGVETSRIVSETPSTWSTTVHGERTGDAHLLVCGRSFVIAESFCATRQPT